MTLYAHKNMKELRMELGLSQAEFADQIGVTRSALGAYEEGRAQPPLPVIASVMDFCELPKEDLYEFIFNQNYLQ